MRTARRSLLLGSLFLLGSLLLLATGCIAAEGARARTSSEGLDYLLRLPPGYAKSAPKELWILLHGAGDTHENFLTAWAPLDCLKDAVLAVPQGVDGRWSSAALPQLVALLGELATEFAPERIYVAGYSAGGGMAYLLGLSHRERLAGLLVDAAGTQSPPPPGEHDLPIYHIHGELDEKIPLAAGQETVDALRAAGYQHVLLRVLVNTNHILRPWAISGGVAWLRARAGLPAASDGAANLAAALSAQAASETGRARVLAERASAAATEGDEATRIAAAKILVELDEAAIKQAKKLATKIQGAKGRDRDWQADDDMLRALHPTEQVRSTLDDAIARLKKKHDSAAAPLLKKGEADDARKDYLRAISSWAKIQNECYLADACKTADAKINEYLRTPEIRAKLNVR